MLEEKPSKKPWGFVVVKPTRMLSAMVERQEPKKSYLTEELDRRLTPISVKKMKLVIVDWEKDFFCDETRKWKIEEEYFK